MRIPWPDQITTKHLQIYLARINFEMDHARANEQLMLIIIHIQARLPLLYTYMYHLKLRASHYCLYNNVRFILMNRIFAERFSRKSLFS
jgi:hypothetical protein